MQNIQSDFLHYDPPIGIFPEYFEQFSEYPPYFPASYFAHLTQLSFDFQRTMHLKYLSVARLIELDKFDHFLLEGQIPENLDIVTSIVPMQIISKDIVIIDLYSDI